LFLEWEQLEWLANCPATKTTRGRAKQLPGSPFFIHYREILWLSLFRNSVWKKYGGLVYFKAYFRMRAAWVTSQLSGYQDNSEKKEAIARFSPFHSLVLMKSLWLTLLRNDVGKKDDCWFILEFILEWEQLERLVNCPVTKTTRGRTRQLPGSPFFIH
jgi:hypothetical protein